MVQCLRAFKLDQQKDWAALVKRPPLAQGELLHIGMAHFYAGVAIDRRGQVWVGARKYEDKAGFYTWEEAIPILAEKYDISEHVPLVMAFMYEYVQKPSYLLNDVIALEYELQTHLPRLPADRDLYTQRADLICKDDQGRYYIVDHKKVHSVTSRTFDQFTLDGQFLGYAALGRKLWGHDFRGVFLHRCHLESKVADCRPINSAPEAVTGHFSNLVAWERVLIQLEQEQADPFDYPASTSEHVCHGKYGPCDHINKCRYG